MIYGIKGFMGFKKTKSLQIIYQGTMAEATVVLKLNQGTIRQKGCNLLSGSFFGSFLDNLSRYFREAKNCLNHDLWD